MIDFRMDEEQKMLTEAIGRYAKDRVRKAFRDAEEDGEVPADVIAAGWEIGLLPTALPEAFGGFGEYSLVTNALALEEFGWGDLATALHILAPNLVVHSLDSNRWLYWRLRSACWQAYSARASSFG